MYFRYIAAGKIPVGQAVGADLAQDAVSGADALDAFLHKRGTEVFLAESNQPVIGLQQIGDDNVTVIHRSSIWKRVTLLTK